MPKTSTPSLSVKREEVRSLNANPAPAESMEGLVEDLRRKREEHYKQYRRKYWQEHKERKRAYDKQYRLVNKDRLRVKNREHMRRYWRKIIATDPIRYEQRKAYMRNLGRQRYANNPQKYKDKARLYEQNNRAKLRICQNRRNREVKLTALQKYGGMCVCCGESEVGFLTMDHVKSNGALHRKSFPSRTLGFYRWLCKHPVSEDFQVMCMNCNWGRGKNNGVCPHKTPQGTVFMLLNLK